MSSLTAGDQLNEQLGRLQLPAKETECAAKDVGRGMKNGGRLHVFVLSPSFLNMSCAG